MRRRPGGKEKVAVSFALFVEAFGFCQGPVFMAKRKYVGACGC
jgi:hypothetical protein